MYELRSPLSAQLELTEACNNTCKSCYNYWRYLSTGVILKKDDMSLGRDHFQALLSMMIDNEVFKITFTGGEPLLRRDVLFDLISLAKARGRVVGLNTNATLLRTSDAARLKELGVDVILVSLLSGDADVHNSISGTNSFENTTRAISLLRGQGLNVGVNMVVSKLNAHTVDMTIDLMREMGLESFSATPVLACPLAISHQELRLDRTEVCQMMDSLIEAMRFGLRVDVLEPLPYCMFDDKQLGRYLPILKNRYCCAGITDMAVSNRGDVRACVLSHQTSGNLIKDGWNECWKNLSEWRTPNVLPQTCLDCGIVDLCGGGCRISAYSESGSLNAPDPYLTGPIDEEEFASKFGQIPVISDLEIGPNDRCRIKDTALAREEAFGGVVSYENDYVFLTQQGFEFLRLLMICGEFSLNSLKHDHPDKEGLAEFVAYLYTKKLVRVTP